MYRRVSVCVCVWKKIFGFVGFSDTHTHTHTRTHFDSSLAASVYLHAYNERLQCR